MSNCMPSAQSVLAELNHARHREWCLEQELQAIKNPVMRSAVEWAQTFDHNWYSATIWEPRRQLYRAEVEVFLNGPLLGDGSLTHYVPEELHELHFAGEFEFEESYNNGDVDNVDYHLCYYNPRHRWEIKPNGLLFELVGGQQAHVLSVNPDGSFVVQTGHNKECYTIERLNEELAYPHKRGQVRRAHYVPFRLPLSVFGHRVFQTPQEFYAAKKKQRKQKEVQEQW